MMNEVVIVGQIAKISEMYQNCNGSKETEIVLKVQRNMLISGGKHEYDLIPVILWEAIAKMMIDVCTIGSMIGIKGRINYNQAEKFNIICEKISFMDKYSFTGQDG